MLVYILKSVACLSILFVFYKIFLEKENMHVFKRFYLLGALIFSLIIPSLVFTEYVEAAPIIEGSAPVVMQQTTNTDDIINVPPALEADLLDIEPLLWGVYFLGVFFFGLKFIRNLFQIFKRIRSNPKLRLSRFTQVLLQEKITPHTFFNYIFLNKKKFEGHQIPTEVLLHEETHAQQKHSWDVVLVELLQVFFWVNPFIYFTKKAIKLNHEFLADQAVLKKNINKTTYQNTLLSYLSPDSAKKYQPLANAINYSSIKKRFKIMKTHTSKKAILLRSLLLLPLLAMLIYGFSDTELKEKTTSQSIEQIAPKKVIDKVNEIRTDYDSATINIIGPKSNSNFKSQDGASRKLMSEYNTLAKKYNTMLSKSKGIQIKMKDVERLEFIYDQMSDKQKADAEPFPDFPPMPESPTPPEAPRVKKREKSDIPSLPPAPDHEEIEKAMELKEAAKMREQEVMLEGQESILVEQEILMEKQESQMEEQVILLTQQVARMKEHETELIEIEEVLEKVSEIEEVSEVEETTEVEEIIEVEPPMPPTLPKSPLDHVMEMAKKDATFYYEGKEISSDKAINILKNNKEINIDSRTSNRKKPVVKLSIEPITIDN